MRSFLRWAAVAAIAACLTAASAPFARADDPIACTFFFGADTSELEWLPREVRSAQCIERDRFEVLGRQYLVVDLVGYDPASAEWRAGVVREAVMRSIGYYRAWFTTPETLFIFGHLGSVRRMSRNGQALAVTQADGVNCIVSVDDAAAHLGRTVGEDRTGLAHTIAHELFHCVQQTQADLHHEHVAWRDEGTAEFFSGRAIHEAPYNTAYGRNLSRIDDQPLYALDESAAPFIFYLGNTRGEEAVVDLLRNATHDTSPNAQVATLRTIPGVDALFHDFARAWVDGALVDQMGRGIALAGPRYGAATHIARARTLTFETSPFLITTRPLAFERGTAWGLEAIPDRDIRAAWRQNDAWSELRTDVDACREGVEGVLFVTQSAGDGEAFYERSLEITERPEAVAAGCTCPIGTWTMETEALGAGPAMMPGTLTDGSVSVTFREGGSAVAEYRDVTFESSIDRDSAMRTILNGTITWSWRRLPWDEHYAGPRPVAGDVADSFMIERTVTSVDAGWRVVFLARGASAGERTTPLNTRVGNVSTTPGMCVGNTLRLLPNRVMPIPNVPPWQGIFQAGG